MKHAYLIMAHHEFEVLGKLVQALDDERNDIYIHFDKKVKNYPLLKTVYKFVYSAKADRQPLGAHCTDKGGVCSV